MKKREDMYKYLEKQYNLNGRQIQEILSWMPFESRETFLKYWEENSSLQGGSKKDYNYNNAKKIFLETSCILLLNNIHKVEKNNVIAIGMLVSDVFWLKKHQIGSSEKLGMFDAEYMHKRVQHILSEKEKSIIKRFYGFSGESKISMKEVGQEVVKHSTQWCYTCLRKGQNKIRYHYIKRTL